MTVAAPLLQNPAAFDDERTRKAFEGLFGIMDLWNVERPQMRRILGSPPERTFYVWKASNARRVPEDTLRWIGYVAGIYKALQILNSDPSQADQWVHRRKTGTSAISRRWSAWRRAT